MKVVAVKTVRFSKLVESYGQPASKTLWVDPRTDPDLKKAIKENRVLTVAQANVGFKKDIGIIGFFPDKRGAFLLFPKPLAYAAGTKVIGIKWGLIKESLPSDPVDWKKLRKNQPATGAKIKPPPGVEPSADVVSGPPQTLSARKKPEAKPPKIFQATIQVQAVQELTIMVEAKTIAEARARASDFPIQINWSKAATTRKIKAVKLQGSKAPQGGNAFVITAKSCP